MRTFFTLLFVSLFATSFAQKAPTNNFEISKKWQNLLDKNLTNFEVFIGVPHTSVDIDYDHKSDNVHKGIPLGLNNDPKKVMSTMEEDGDLILKVSGEIYAGLTSLQEFENYHLKAQFKFGEKKWAPRLDAKRDNGILYHCHGEHGAFWNVWMASLECQIQETDMGDFVALVNTKADVASSKVKGVGNQVVGANDKMITYGAGKGNLRYCHINKTNENAHGEWNTIEIICYKNKSIHVVNGKVVMTVLNTRKVIDGKDLPLTKGKIQLQCEGAEAYYKDVQIKSINGFSRKYKKQAGL